LEERLQKFLARAGICSRRKAEAHILAGRVRVDGRVVTALGTKVDPVRQRIEFDGRPVVLAEEKVYFLLNKPRGVVCTLHDPQGRPTVVSLLSGVSQRVFPVGRLDVDTEGALILTNDGAFAHRILHPRFEIHRTYRAVVQGRPKAAVLDRLRRGVMLDGRRTWPAAVHLVRRLAGGAELEITIHEGRKRQVRRMCAAVGHPVVALRRIAYGGLPLGSLPVGRYRPLDAADLARIFTPFGPPGRSPGG